MYIHIIHTHTLYILYVHNNTYIYRYLDIDAHTDILIYTHTVMYQNSSQTASPFLRWTKKKPEFLTNGVSFPPVDQKETCEFAINWLIFRSPLSNLSRDLIASFLLVSSRTFLLSSRSLLIGSRSLLLSSRFWFLVCMQDTASTH
eukprot:Gregarina_sp_Poly_1__8468@NODE_499_length_7894_cov_59_656446_g399_i0_p6_GENE_NODE_499_length_7894_cov_59_656446_g399_i0NODE_499_length_7894_cov_59_656446_g399_i0_p6_ORF_typecomplete_len145_score2_04_NODE_499_length_7894_cov_59_656446_g399_i0520954